MSILQDFHDLRRVGTPWVCIRTTDYRATMLNLLKYESEYTFGGKKRKEPELVKATYWDCVRGARSPLVDADDRPVCAPLITNLGGEENDTDCVTVLKNALEMDTDSILFLIVPKEELFDNPYVVQAIANLRDPFKGRGCILVMIGVDIKLPPLIAEDVPVLDDPLPTRDELAGVIEEVINAKNAQLAKDSKKPLELEVEEIERAAGICLGMTRFAVEEGAARKLLDTGIDFAGLTTLQRNVVEQSSGNALKFETQPWTFKDMGGADAFRQFMQGIYKGPRRPRLVVRVDEIDKNITSASTGTVADNTGVSQDLLRAFLLTLEDNDHLALLSVGPPGVGKTLSSIAVGNEHGAKTLAFDMGAVKGSLVGESEQRMRRIMQIILAMGGADVLWIATCNRIDTLPPELQARFWLGTWFWDLPTDAEKKLIWSIQRKRYGTDPKDKQPDDSHWVGRDIRNACRLAKYSCMSLCEAARFITVTGVVNALEIEKSRDTAQKRGYLSASIAGPYKRPEARQGQRQMKG